ncbi:MAG: rod-binding protein [Planctomycetota bacterium]
MIDSVATATTKTHDPAAVHRAAAGMEGLFLSLLLAEMQKGLGQEAGGLFGDAAGSGVYEGFFETYLADAIARRGGIGIAKMVERTVLHAAPTPPAKSP